MILLWIRNRCKDKIHLQSTNKEGTKTKKVEVIEKLEENIVFL